MTTLLTPRPEVIGRFLEKIVPQDSGCWLWCGSTNGRGYGKLRLNHPRRLVLAHRFAYESFVGQIPRGLTVDHLCGIRACVNPDHLEPVTTRENLLRGDTTTARNAAKTHCPQGHLYDAKNTYLYRGSRQCKVCMRARNRERWEELKRRRNVTQTS